MDGWMAGYSMRTVDWETRLCGRSKKRMRSTQSKEWKCLSGAKKREGSEEEKGATLAAENERMDRFNHPTASQHTATKRLGKRKD